MCSIEEKLESGNKLPSFHRRYVDDTLAMVLLPKATSWANVIYLTLNVMKIEV